jgi:geranylgeranyl diphosphate synthase type II
VPPAAAYPEDLQRLVEGYLERLSFSHRAETDGLAEAMRYSLLAGGKRIRPVLCLATARALGSDPAEVLPTAAALELIHTYSLIHDDLPAMDDDDLRRGRPTSHKAFGEDVAILAGDALFAEAMRLIAAEQSGRPELVLAALGEVSAATGVDGMVGGQYYDVKGGPADAASLRLLHSLKTGRLIAASVCSALALADAGEEEQRTFRAFAEEIGLLFQIVDDVLDATGTAEELGKTPGKDAAAGKVTYVSLYGLERARALADESRARVQAALEDIPADTTVLAELTATIRERRA